MKVITKEGRHFSSSVFIPSKTDYLLTIEDKNYIRAAV